MTINAGTQVVVKTADGLNLPRRAVTEVVEGHDFPVVWITTEEEWSAAETAARSPEAWPWPAEDVQPTGSAVAA